MKDISTTETCPRDDIAAYIDGELPVGPANELEAHLQECAVCGRTIVSQRQLLAALSVSLECRPIPELPTDFTRKIVVTAESSVAGLRRPNELFTAIFICSALGLFVIFALGGDTLGLTSAAAGLAEKFLAVSAFVLRLLVTLVIAAALVLRVMGAQVAGTGAGIAAMAVCGGLVLTVSARWAARRRHA